ncbi:MAG TPA: CRTAC1 family protein [Vicinamibacterales bacterium]|nr:CRTAC1 family protein [Vicinamibacterales bacterium]
MTRALLAAFMATAIVGGQQHVPVFEPMQPELLGAGLTFTNAFADYDNDGDLDLFVGFDGKPNRLYRNDKGTFADVAGAAGIADSRPTRAAAWGDFDGDGDADLLLGFTPQANASVLTLYRNTAGTFADATGDAGLTVAAGAVRQPAWIDFDGDGDLDLFVAFRDRPNALYRNDAGRLIDVAASIGVADPRRTVGAVWFDYDQDGDLDVAVANMDGDANGLFRNDGGSFTEAARAAGVEWGGRAPRSASNGTVRVCAEDIDTDGRFDLFAANYGPLGFFSNRGNGTFEDRAAQWSIAIDSRYDACAFADFDHDGRVDLYVNGTVTGGVSWQDSLFRNTGSAFVDVTPPSIRKWQADHGVQWADVDQDGDMDLALTGARADGTHVIMRNQLAASDAARGLHVRVLDARGRATRAGAEVRVFAAGSARLIGARLVDGGSGYDSQNDMPVHVGVPADVTRVDVQVIMPQRGRRVPVWERGVRPGRTVTVRTN